MIDAHIQQTAVFQMRGFNLMESQAEHTKLVQRSVVDLGGGMTQMVILFYQRLFELNPNLKPIFKDDFELQRDKFLDTLSFVVERLDTPENIIEPVKQLGLRHFGYGVRNEHYETVAVALLWALEQSLGSAFTNEVRVAWQQTYYKLAELMQAASQL